jgi:2-dehydropantoate 2-reductase
VLGAVVAFGASCPEPGVFERTSAGGFVLGYLEAPVDERVHALGRLLEAIGPVDTTDNLRGARWSKLAINCAISSIGTVAGERLGALLMHRFARRMALEIMSEVVTVAQAENVTLEKVAGTVDLDWLALTQAERRVKGSTTLLAKHALLLAVGSRFRRLRSSMLAQIERGQQPPIDYLNGEVIGRARRHRLGVPVNVAVHQCVERIAAGELRSSLDTLRALYEDTRAAVVMSEAA